MQGACLNDNGDLGDDRACLDLQQPHHPVGLAIHPLGAPNTNSCRASNADGGILGQDWGGTSAEINATSAHSGGVNVCFADGSVRFVKNSVALPTWWALGTRNGNETVSADSY